MTVTAADFGYVSTLVRQRSAIVLEPGKEYLVEARLLPVARAAGLGSVGDLVAQVRRAPAAALAERVVEAMTTNETSWFRDVHPFALLTDHLLPALAVSRATERRIRVWSAASSTGQEAYSIAMLLSDWLRGRPGWSATILGTDLSQEVVDKARAGRYSQLEVNRGLPAPMLVRHFVRSGTEWQVGDGLRRMVEFRTLNLAAPFPALPSFDVVFCRNVLIYFDTATRRQVLDRIVRTMRPDGALLLGAAETTMSLGTSLERVQVDRASYHRTASSGRTTP